MSITGETGLRLVTAASGEPRPSASHRLAVCAQAERLLVASDLDGTLAPIVERPDLARVRPGALAALGSLAALPNTSVAVISGRPLEELRGLVGAASWLHLIGSHGAEDPSGELRLTAAQEALKAELIALAEEAVAGTRCWVEHKPAGFAVHDRQAPDSEAAEVRQRVLKALAGRDVRSLRGHRVLEVSVVTEVDKGKALQRLRERLGATCVVFAGDDTTDERAFATLAAHDLGIKVGPGATVAPVRVEDPAALESIFHWLVEARSRFTADAS